ncbi:uncharacterized protein LOC126896780 isoform X1 [Daktulosphaira vitifoliae]|uniref:uncharacterized protein LOC126896780 isoform X1 n=1 Tax=Daktulosphaira vitifoliae TaxID=58002 RepID=UPI0021AA698F|nr:uncharacterized protein LOC126896780 isoform X1 [Daktulosphaira vitifoliae]
MSDKVMLVLGEASESEDEDVQYNDNNRSILHLNTESKNQEFDIIRESNTISQSKLKKTKKRNQKKDIVQGENSKISEDTLLHRKLKEKNMQFYSNISILSTLMYSNAVNELNETDQQLVKAQVLLQETVNSWKYIEQNLSHVRRKLTDILSEDYIPKINI